MIAPSAEAVSGLLARARAHWLPIYFPAGQFQGATFLIGDPGGAAGKSLPIPLRARPDGMLRDFGGDWSGDDLALMARAIGAGDDMKAAYREALGYLGLDDREQKARADARPKQSLPDPNSQLAQEIWRETVRIRDRIALDYLVCRRGITAWDDDRVRWHPACPWGEDRVGVIVCPVVSHLTGYTVGIWRIRPAMEGQVERRGLGPAKHNCAPIWWPEGDGLAITEGVEDALAVRALTGLPSWAALSAGGMAEMRGIPDRLRRISIFADADPVGQNAAHRLAGAVRAEGRKVRVLRSLTGKDANDALLAGARS